MAPLLGKCIISGSSLGNFEPKSCQPLQPQKRWKSERRPKANGPGLCRRRRQTFIRKLVLGWWWWWWWWWWWSSSSWWWYRNSFSLRLKNKNTPHLHVSRPSSTHISLRCTAFISWHGNDRCDDFNTLHYINMYIYIYTYIVYRIYIYIVYI